MINNYTNPVLYIEIAAVILAILTIILVFGNSEKIKKYNKAIFLFIVLITLIPTFYLAGNTVYKNLNSVTSGPIHWHADYQIWVCDNKIDLINPSGFKNKIGTPLFHEHNDDRIHVEGTVNDIEDIKLVAFFKTIGGELTPNTLKYPTSSDELIDVKTGDSCGNEAAQLKVYVNGKEINNVESYMYYPHPGIPPGDCIIVEFGNNLENTTDRICDFWASNDWNYDNYKELRKQSKYQPTWMGEGWEYIDGQGLVEVNK